MISKFIGCVLVLQDIPLILVFAKMLFFTAERVPQVQVFKDRPGDVSEVPELGVRYGAVGGECGKLYFLFSISIQTHLFKAEQTSLL